MQNANGVESDIYSLLIPLADQRLLVPRANVTEVAGYRQPKSIPGALPWLLGTINWDGANVPLISFEGACGGPIPKVGVRTRVVLFRALSDALDSRIFGILTHGFPQLVRVNPNVLSIDESNQWAEGGPVLCQVRMVNQTPLIPDIEGIEHMIADALAVAS